MDNVTEWYGMDSGIVGKVRYGIVWYGIVWIVVLQVWYGIVWIVVL